MLAFVLLALVVAGVASILCTKKEDGMVPWAGPFGPPFPLNFRAADSRQPRADREAGSPLAYQPVPADELRILEHELALALGDHS